MPNAAQLASSSARPQAAARRDQSYWLAVVDVDASGAVVSPARSPAGGSFPTKAIGAGSDRRLPFAPFAGIAQPLHPWHPVGIVRALRGGSQLVSLVSVFQ